VPSTCLSRTSSTGSSPPTCESLPSATPSLRFQSFLGLTLPPAGLGQVTPRASGTELWEDLVWSGKHVGVAGQGRPGPDVQKEEELDYGSTKVGHDDSEEACHG
jgi:hypothetical protein